MINSIFLFCYHTPIFPILVENQFPKDITKKYMNTRSSCRIVRVRKEMEDLVRDSQVYVSIKTINIHPDFHSGTFAFAGPISSPYEGYWFRVFVEWPVDYPWKPPKFTLLDKIWNPYVDFEKNTFCVDILSYDVSPALTTQKYLVSLASLIGETKIKGNDDGFANPKAAAQMMNNYPYFEQHARKICQSNYYKFQPIYKKSEKPKPQIHEIQPPKQDVEEIVEKQAKDPQMQKQKRKIIKKRTARRFGRLRHFRPRLP